MSWEGGGLRAWLRALFGGGLRPALALAGAGTGCAEPAPGTAVRVDVLLNMGGPRSRTRGERIRASIFPPGCRRGCSLGSRRVGSSWALVAGEGSLRERVLAVLSELGFADPEDAFARLDGIPRTRLHCRIPRRVLRGTAADRNPRGFLRKALVLAKCCRGLYDPERPVILTEHRLRQRLELYGIDETFYATKE